jgi:hypothetical protein
VSTNGRTSVGRTSHKLRPTKTLLRPLGSSEREALAGADGDAKVGSHRGGVGGRVALEGSAGGAFGVAAL